LSSKKLLIAILLLNVISRYPNSSSRTIFGYLKHIGVHCGDNVVQEIGLSCKKFLCRISHHLFSLFGVLGGNAVPKDLKKIIENK
jgi:hypothetical protein